MKSLQQLLLQFNMHSFLTPVNTNSVKYNNAEIPPNMSTVDNKGKTGFTSIKITFVLENVVHIGMQRTQPEISTSSGNKNEQLSCLMLLMILKMSTQNCI